MMLGAAKKLVDAYRAKLGFDPDFAAIEVYDMVNMVAAGHPQERLRWRGHQELHRRASRISRALVAARSASTRMGKRSCRWRFIELKDVEKPVFEEIKP